MLMVTKDSGRITWQNSASCAALGIFARDITQACEGSAVPEFDFLQQLFWQNEVRLHQGRHCRA